jgi:hypothetical protein
MGQPMWRKIVPELKVPEAAGQPWTLALEVLTAGRIMKLEVVVDTTRAPPERGEWTPKDFSAACKADGDFTGTARPNPPVGTPLVASASLGALIARIGGSTADQTADGGQNPARIIFSVGRKCIFTVPTAPTGSLFLGVNDDPSRMTGLTGHLLVDIYEAI